MTPDHAWSACPICGHADWTPQFDTLDFDTRDAFTIGRCGGCGVQRTWPVPADLGRYYQMETGQGMTATPPPVFQWMKAILLRREVARLQRWTCPAPFVDIGCGAGDLSRLLHRAGYPVVAVDMGPRRPALLEGLPIPYHAIDPENAAIADLPRLSGTVIMRHVLEHVRDPVQRLMQLQAAGAEAFYLVVPNASGIEARVFGSAWWSWDPPRHLWHFRMPTLQATVRQAGLRVVAHGAETIPGIVPSLYRWLRVRGTPSALCRWCRPKSTLSAVSAPLNLLLPNNVLWLIAERNR